MVPCHDLANPPLSATDGDTVRPQTTLGLGSRVWDDIETVFKSMLVSVTVR